MKALVPLLLLGGVGVGVAVASSTSSRPVRTRRLLPVNLLGPSSSSPVHEKFMDPLFVCTPGDVPYSVGGGARMRTGWLPVPIPTHLEWLQHVPNNAAARIAAMRVAIDGAARTDLAMRDLQLGLVIAESKKQLDKLASEMFSAYDTVARNAGKAKALATQFGVSTSAVTDEANAMVSAFKTSDVSAVSAAVKRWGPIAQTTATAVVDVVRAASGGGGGANANTIALLSAVGSLASLVPVFGQFLSFVANTAAGTLAQKDAAAAEFCRDFNTKIWKLYADGLQASNPMPWHASAIFPDKCPPSSGAKATGYGNSDTQERLYSIFEFSNFFGNEMPAAFRTPMRQWWALAMVFMDDPRVKDAFRTFGFDSAGGVIANDTQVMLVAAPIAVANGLDVDDFARRLWDASQGWRGGRDAWWMNSLARYGKVKDECAKRGTSLDCWCDLPANAWWVNWAVLARDAFELARQRRPLTVRGLYR